MKSVLISIQPKWCELIASGKKTVEVRKTKPKLEVPFKCYIYETMKPLKDFIFDYKNLTKTQKTIINGRGKVIGEFVCDRIENFLYEALDITYMLRKFKGTVNEEFFEGTQVTYQEAYDYCKGMDWNEDYSDIFYGWHISDLKLYDKPRELSEFYTIDNEAVQKCENRSQTYYQFTDTGYIKNGFVCDYKDEWCSKCKRKVLTRPPQSWGYVESEDTE